MLISEYSEPFEIIVVEIIVTGKEIRLISGYGPQESWTEEERMPFFITLEEEINKADMMGKSIIIQTDANSKLGQTFIPKDPHCQSPNVTLLCLIHCIIQLALMRITVMCVNFNAKIECIYQKSKVSSSFQYISCL